MIPITLALVNTLVYAISSVIGRYVIANSTGNRLTAQKMIADVYLILGIIFGSAFMMMKNPYSFTIVMTVGSISILGCIGSFLITEAIVYGKGGPA